MTTCYQCEKPVNYLFSDSRCFRCTGDVPEWMEESFEERTTKMNSLRTKFLKERAEQVLEDITNL
jgi:hypothetical protein